MVSSIVWGSCNIHPRQCEYKIYYLIVLPFWAKMVTLDENVIVVRVLIPVFPDTLGNADPQNPGEKNLPSLTVGLCCCTQMDSCGQIHLTP